MKDFIFKTGFFFLLLFVSTSSFARPASDFTISGGDSLELTADDAIRYVRFVHFLNFRDAYSASRDPSGKGWIVSAERDYLSKKVIKSTAGENLYYNKRKGALVHRVRSMTIQGRNLKISNRMTKVEIRRDQPLENQ
jgi:hypothetical protein